MDPKHSDADPDSSFTLMRIQIRLFALMRIRILLIKVLQTCDHWSTGPPRLHFEPERFLGPSIAVLGIEVRICMFLHLPNPHPDPLVTSKDADPDPSIIKKKLKEKPIFYSFVTS